MLYLLILFGINSSVRADITCEVVHLPEENLNSQVIRYRITQTGNKSFTAYQDVFNCVSCIGTKNDDNTTTVELIDSLKPISKNKTDSQISFSSGYGKVLGIPKPFTSYGTRTFHINLEDGSGQYIHDYHENHSNFESPRGDRVNTQELRNCQKN